MIIYNLSFKVINVVKLTKISNSLILKLKSASYAKNYLTLDNPSENHREFIISCGIYLIL